MTEYTEIAAAWLAGLAARGVRVALRNGRLAWEPTRAYGEMTDEEVITLRHHRDEIKDAIAAGAWPDLGPSFPVTDRRRVTAEPTPPKACPSCGRTPCIGPDHFAFATLHPNDPTELARRQDAHAKEFWMQMARLDWRSAVKWANRTL
jgi:hypothetical protein